MTDEPAAGAPAFKDHFSGHADQYAAARPTYPNELIEFVARAAPARERAWDAATGNGQAARALADRFRHVHASDASGEQIRAADPHPGVTFRCEPAEHCSLAEATVDAVTVAQAAHWLDLPRFYDECRRVLRPGGVIALWCYGLSQVSPSVDALFARFYHQTLAGYWPSERRHIETGYAELPFPWPTLDAPTFRIQASWLASDYLAYLRSWSATRRYQAATGRDPVAELAAPLAAAWGGQVRAVHWPIHLKLAVAVAR